MTTDDEQAAATSALRAIAHPLRLRMLSLLTGSAMSAAEVARELDLTHANASYHLRLLADAGELEVAGEERIRGGVAKRYRYPAERDTTGSRTRRRSPHSPDDLVLYVRAVGQEMERRIQQRTPGEHPTVSSDLEGWVTPETWARACELMREASRLLHQHNQPPRSPGTIHVSATEVAFQMVDAQAVDARVVDEPPAPDQRDQTPGEEDRR